MKKSILLYLLWDLLLYCIFYISYAANSFFTKMASEKFNVSYTLISMLINTLLFIIIGIGLGVLNNIYSRYERSVRIAIAEFIIIGINGLLLSVVYLAGWCLIYNIIPMWLLNYSSILSVLGSVILGYEIIIFINRLKVNK